ncbi:MAG: type VI secretion system protein TssA [Sulfuriferula sp.]|nr:type VI secretion system protein TssA [Sulfuriferula sp.]
MWNANALLNPIRPGQPAGDDLSFSRDFDAIAEARRFDDPSLDQGEWEVDLKEADWQEVIALTTRLLEQQSKDLRLAVWLTEASAYQHGFSGLTQGFELIAGLCESFWDNLYPEDEEGDQERRAGNLSWIVTRAEQLVRDIPLTEGRGTAYSYANILDARNRTQNKDNAGRSTGVSMEAIDSARRKSSYAFYQTRLAEAHQCAMALTRLQTAIDARLGMDGPGFTALRQSLDDVSHTLTRFANDQGMSASAALAQVAAKEADVTQAPSTSAPRPVVSPPAVTGAIQSRAQAIAQLREVARYFRETEPHSPVAYLADKAAQWGNLPLHEWLRTVIKDNTSLSHVEELLGLESDNHGDPA